MLVDQQPPQRVFVCDHAGLVINTFSHACPTSRFDHQADHQILSLAQVNEEEARKMLTTMLRLNVMDAIL